MEDIELWKRIHISPYDQVYEISTRGNLRKISNKFTPKTHIRNGYSAVSLYDPISKKSKTVNIHPLVATAFLKKDHEKLIVNHKNSNKTDNRVENLEWVTSKENAIHSINSGIAKFHTVAIEQYTVDEVYIRSFHSIKEACNTLGYNTKHISAVCSGVRKTANGFKWKYKIPREIIDDCEGKIIDGFPDYKITESGKVFSRRAKKFLKPKVLQSGYLCVKLCNNGVHKDVYICKLLREYFNKVISPKS